MKRPSRKANNRRRFRGSQAKLESLEARMVMDAAGYEAALDSFMGADRVGKDGPMAILGWDLTLMYHNGDVEAGPDDPDAVDGGNSEPLSSPIRDKYLIDSQNRILVDLAAKDAGSKAQLITSLAGIGFVKSGEYNNTISGWMPISSLAQLAALPTLGGVSPPMVTTSAGSVESQGDASMLTDQVRTEYGYDGAGQKIGVLSDSYNGLGTAATDVATGDLPGVGNPEGYTTPVQVLQDYISPNSTDEGRGMLQLVHDVAPGAELAFTTAFNGKAGFAQGIYDLANAGSTVIVDDVGYATEPWFSDGIIAQAADGVVQNNVAYFTAAGNSARKSYESDFRSSGTTYAEGDIASAAGAPTFFGGTSFDFDSGAGVDDRQSVTIAAGGFIQLAFQWDDTFFTESGITSSSDLDIYLLVGGQIVAGGVDTNVDAYESLVYVNAGATDVDAEIMIVSYEGNVPTRIKYNIFRGDMVTNEFATDSGTAVGHSNAAYAMSVGAAYYQDTPAFGTTPAAVESFSSAGGTPILLDPAGNRITPVYRQNVDIVAPDGTDTTFFPTGPIFSTDSDGNGLPNFFGTSAAAPHAAALAALMRQANSILPATEIHKLLRDTAIDMDDPSTSGFDVGYDFGTGYGFVNGVEAIRAAIFASGDTIGSPDACGVYTGPAAIEVQAGLGANVFVTGHSILDNGVENGQLGYDYEILNFLRGQGTSQEIAAANYSIAVLGNDDDAWNFSSGGTTASGYESTTFYDIDNVTPAVWSQILAHDGLIILSDVYSVTTGGLDELQIDSIVSAKSDIAAAVNGHGLDIWAGGGTLASGYYDFLPSGTVFPSDLATSATIYEPSVEGRAIGITSSMANAAESLTKFDSLDDNLFVAERRDFDEIVSVAGQNVAFVDNQIVAARDETEILMHGVIGYKFNDLNMDGIRQANEPGLAGFTFFIDENGDGKIGLCEPSAITDANGMFTLYPRASGTFNIVQVTEPGYLTTDEIPHIIYVDGSRITLNAPLNSGAVVAIDYGDPGNPYAAHPVIDGLQFGDSPMEDDGVVFGSGLKIGTNTVSINSSTVLSPGILQAWMDFNKDGDFDDPGEQIFKNVQLTPGTHNYSFVIPNTVIDDSSLPEAYRIPLTARFRIDYTLNLGPTGTGFAGEVEDYDVYIKQAPESGLFLDDDSFTYIEDTAGQVYDVLANDKSFFNRALTLVDVTAVTPGALASAFSIVDNKIVFDATGVTGLGSDIVVTYKAMDSAGFMETANLTLQLNGAGAVVTSSSAFVNLKMNGDVNNDGVVSTHDLATLMYELEHLGARTLPKVGKPDANFKNYIDVNGDGEFNVLDVGSMIAQMIQFWAQKEGEAVDAALADAEPVSESVSVDSTSLIQQASYVAPTTSSTTSSSSSSSSTGASPSTNVSLYLAGVLEKSSQQGDLTSERSSTSAGDSDLEDEYVDYFYPEDSLQSRLIESTTSSTLMTEEVESSIDEIAIDVEAAWEEDLISG